MVMDFMPHSSFIECWSARSPLDNQGIFRQLLATVWLAEFPLYPLVCEAIAKPLTWYPLIQFPQWTHKSQQTDILHGWLIVHVTFGQTVIQLTKQVEKWRKTTTKVYWPLFRAGLNHISWHPNWENQHQYWIWTQLYQSFYQRACLIIEGMVTSLSHHQGSAFGGLAFPASGLGVESCTSLHTGW